MKIKILPAYLNDLADILRLQKECYLSEADIYQDNNIPPLLQDLESLKNEFNNSTILKAVIDNKIIASIRAFYLDGTCYIGKLIVKEEYQNKGIGKKIFHAMELVYKDCNRYELFTGFKSKKNLYLYNKLGYTEYKQELISDKLTLLYFEKINNHEKFLR